MKNEKDQALKVPVQDPSRFTSLCNRKTQPSPKLFATLAVNACVPSSWPCTWIPITETDAEASCHESNAIVLHSVFKFCVFFVSVKECPSLVLNMVYLLIDCLLHSISIIIVSDWLIVASTHLPQKKSVIFYLVYKVIQLHELDNSWIKKTLP